MLFSARYPLPFSHGHPPPPRANEQILRLLASKRQQLNQTSCGAKHGPDQICFRMELWIIALEKMAFFVSAIKMKYADDLHNAAGETWRIELGLGMIKVRAKSKILARTFFKDWKQQSLKAHAQTIIYVCWKIAAATQQLLSAAGRPLLSALGLPPIQSSHLCVLVQCIFYTYWERVQTCLYYVVQCAFYIFSVWVWYIVCILV